MWEERRGREGGKEETRREKVKWRRDRGRERRGRKGKIRIKERKKGRGRREHRRKEMHVGERRGMRRNK